MTSIHKQRTVFYTIFKNIPYTDGEWYRENNRRMEWQAKSTMSASWKARYRPFKTRPNHKWLWGPTCHTETEARKACQGALGRGAQQVEYIVSSTTEKWFCGRSGVWEKRTKTGR